MERIQCKRPEHELLLLCGRVALAEKDRENIRAIISAEALDFDYFLLLAKKHKVLQLVAKHLPSLDPESKISDFDKYLLHSYYLGIQKINHVKFEELRNILQTFVRRGIKAVPLKGAVLTPTVYRDFGLRTLNDIDFLISLEDRRAASECLKELGYQSGMYNWQTGEVDAVSREEELLWSMHIGNLHPRTKKMDSEYCKYVTVDFSYDVDLQKNYLASRLLLENAVKTTFLGQETYLLNETDFLIHLCIHLYKEASNAQWVIYHNDLNLIKFCDVREYLLTIAGNLDPGRFCQRVRELRAEKGVYYTFHYLDYLYSETYSQTLLKDLGMDDTGFLDEYGHLDYESPKLWKKSFYDRFFSLSNLEELVETSKLERIHAENKINK